MPTTSTAPKGTLVEFWVSRTVAPGVTEVVTNWGFCLGLVVEVADEFTAIPTPGGSGGTFERFADAVAAVTHRKASS